MDHEVGCIAQHPDRPLTLEEVNEIQKKNLEHLRYQEDVDWLVCTVRILSRKE